MMIEVTDMVQRYRLVLRHIWNAGLWVDPDLRRWESVDSFKELKLPLFRALVANPLGFEPGEIFGKQFRVAPESGKSDGIPALQVNQRQPTSIGGGVWKMLLGPFKADEIDLELLDFFDWSPMGYIDLRYYLVLVRACRNHPDVIGHQALVDVSSASVLWSAAESRGSV